MDKLIKIFASRNSIYASLLLAAIIIVLFFLIKPFKEQKLDYLTDTERVWLKENAGKIEALFGGEAPPEAYHDENGNYVGLLVDFLREIERHLGVSFRARNFSTWEELMAYSKSQRNFTIVGIAQTEARSHYLLFTNPFVKIPYVIITKKASAYVTLTDLGQANVCVVKGYAINEYIHQFFPQIIPRQVIDDLQGLRGVATGDCDALVADQAIATFLIEQQGLSNLKISGESGYLNRLGIAVSIHDVVLHGILDKTVDRISPERQRELYGKWVSAGALLSSSMQAGLALGAIAVIGIVAILWLWSVSLRSTVRKQTAQIRHDLDMIQATEEALREKSEELEKFFSNALDLLAIADKDGHFRRLNREWEKALGYPLDALEGQRFLDFVHPEDMAATLAAISNLGAQQEVLNFTNRYRRRDGSYRWIEWRSIPAGKYIYAAARDVTEHKRAEATLRESEDTFRKLFEGSSDPILLLEGGRFVECNQAALKLLGAADKSRFIGSTPLDISPERQPDGRLSAVAAPEYIARAHREGNCRFEWLCQRYDGTPLLLDVSLMPITLRGESLLHITWRDITARKQAEKQLKEEQEFTQAVFDSIPGLLYLYDGEGRLVRWNKQHEELTGYTAEEMAGMHVLDWYRGREPDTSRILQAVQDVMSKGSAEIEAELITKSGKAIPFYFTGVGLTIAGKPYFTGIGIDITERRRVETALKENSAFLNTLLNAIPVPVFYKDTEGRYIGFNEAFTEFYGKKYQELVGKTAFDLAPEYLAEIYHAKDLKLLQHLGPQVYESQVTDARRVVHDVIFHKAMFTDAGGQACGIIGVILDITERKRAEAELQRHREHLEELAAERTAELRQAMAQLVQSEKLAALGSLVAGVAHELNTPLGNARVVASSLGEHLQDFAAAVESGSLRRSQVDAFLNRGREAVDLLERNAARAADLISHFKQVAVDQTSTRRRSFNLGQTVEEVLVTLRPQFKRTAHRIELEIPPELELDSYPGPLEQVIANLIGNSLTHGFAGMEAGCIRIEAHAFSPTQVALCYADNGVGIPTTLQTRIFEPFFTTRLGQGGSGLGLYIVYNLVTGVLGGAIQAHNPPGDGVAFTLTLPCIAPDRPASD